MSESYPSFQLWEKLNPTELKCGYVQRKLLAHIWYFSDWRCTSVIIFFLYRIKYAQYQDWNYFNFNIEIMYVGLRLPLPYLHWSFFIHPQVADFATQRQLSRSTQNSNWGVGLLRVTVLLPVIWPFFLLLVVRFSRCITFIRFHFKWVQNAVLWKETEQKSTTLKPAMPWLRCTTGWCSLCLSLFFFILYDVCRSRLSLHATALQHLSIRVHSPFALLHTSCVSTATAPLPRRLRTALRCRFT